MITLDLSKAKLAEDLGSYKEKVAEIHDMIRNKTGAGNDFLGWVELPENYDKEEVQLMKETAAKLREKVDVLLVCGIGGSYLGARAAIEAINGLYSDDKVEIIYVGNTFSSNYIHQVAKYIEDKDFAINVISKSGTTTETSISFRIFKEMCEKKYGKEGARERIVATTDREKGALKKLATDEGYVTFVVPDDIGGRYSVLTAVGLFPIAMAGIDIDEMLKGAKDAMVKYNDANIETNDAYRYGVARQLLNKAGYSAEMFVTYELQLNNVAEWWKQLFGESEGKEGKGITEERAEEYVFGYSVFNDLSSRDLQTRHGQWLMGKSLDNYTIMGPVIVDRTELPMPLELDIKSYVNGELRQNSNTKYLIKKIPGLIAELSKGITLEAGDIIATGTPAGVGMGFTPPRFLKKGDKVTCEIDRIGQLTNYIV